MKVKELIKRLKSFDPDLDVVTSRYSDYATFGATDIELVNVLEHSKEWWTRYYAHQFRSGPKPTPLKKLCVGGG